VLSERYCTIILGGTALGAVAILEGRGHAIGYLQMVRTLSRFSVPDAAKSVALPQGEGEVAGISYRIRGVGPPLVLLPLFLTPSHRKI
jgi:hypothetical protein